MPHSTNGTLFLVATPIGNLEDISVRALRILREADLIAAEDTRRTHKLLAHYGIPTPMTALHEHNEQERVSGLVARVQGGGRVALVSDAGMPSISDPGFRLVRAAVGAGIRVEVIPGPSAVLTALVVSGLPVDEFVFVGFPPPKAASRRSFYERLREESRTVVLFEAPHRLRGSLADALAALGDRPAAVCRELTKLHEEVVRGSLSSVIDGLSDMRGEFTVVLAGAARTSPGVDDVEVSDELILTEYRRLVEDGAGRRDALAGVARRFGLRAREVFSAVERARHS